MAPLGQQNCFLVCSVQFRCIVLCLPSETIGAWGLRVESAATTRWLERRASPKSPADTNSGSTAANWLGVGNGLPRVGPLCVHGW
jgi:hypothetical protein